MSGLANPDTLDLDFPIAGPDPLFATFRADAVHLGAAYREDALIERRLGVPHGDVDPLHLKARIRVVEQRLADLQELVASLRDERHSAARPAGAAAPPAKPRQIGVPV